MRYFIFVVFTLLIALGNSTLHAQESESLTPRDQIRELKDGVLLVRLPTKQNSIDALLKNGRTAQADQVREQTRTKNLELVAAMQEEFNFCPVYFFFSYDSKHVMSGTLDSIQFLNPELTYDPSIRVDNKTIYTTEVTLISQDTSEKQRNLTNTEEKDRDSENEPRYYGGANMRFEALIIKDDQFQQLSRPFPYYARTLNSFFIKRKLKDVVNTMNGKLWKFYDS